MKQEAQHDLHSGERVFRFYHFGGPGFLISRMKYLRFAAEEDQDVDPEEEEGWGRAEIHSLRKVDVVVCTQEAFLVCTRELVMLTACTVPPHPIPPNPHVQCASVASRMRARRHERSCPSPTPPHPCPSHPMAHRWPCLDVSAQMIRICVRRWVVHRSGNMCI